MENKVCTKCKLEQPITNFGKRGNRLKSNCKSCENEYNRQRLKDPEKYKKHRESVKKQQLNLTDEQKYLISLKRKSKTRNIPLSDIIKEEQIISDAKSQNKKYCYGCKLVLDLTEFNKLSSTKDGLNTKCNKCSKKLSLKYYNNNSEKMNLYKQKFNENNRELVREWQRNYNKKRRDSDPLFKLTSNIRSRLRDYLKNKGIRKNKNSSMFDIVGCSPQELRNHLESLWVEGMSWDNYGFSGWHVDHKTPLSSALDDIDEILKLNHYTNLQPLWGVDNLKKGKKISSHFGNTHRLVNKVPDL
jgi:hypothetical protein